MSKLKLSLLSLAFLFGVSQMATAQVYYPSTHNRSVPHTQTHIDYVPHNGHLHAQQHTTTHYDQVPHTTYRRPYQQQYIPQQQYIQQQQYYPQQQWVQQQQYFPQQQQYFPQQQQHVVPHTTTHNDYIPHNGHIDVVPHTTTHFDTHGH
jgi:hypothetical protein